MPRIDVEWNSADLKKLKRADKQVAAAVRKAGNDTLRSMRAEAKREVRARTEIRAKYLALKAFPLTFPRTSSLDGMEWVMRVSGAPIPLGEFPRRQTRAGVVVQVVRGAPKLIKSAFLAVMRGSSRKGVFLRPGKARYPMGHRLGLRASDAFADGKIPTGVLTYAQTQFSKRFSYWIGKVDG